MPKMYEKRKTHTPFMLIYVKAQVTSHLVNTVRFHQLVFVTMFFCVPTVPQQGCSRFPTNPRESNSRVRAKEQVVPVPKCNMSCGDEMCNTVSTTVTCPSEVVEP